MAERYGSGQISHHTQVPSPYLRRENTTYDTASFWSGERKYLNAKTEIISRNIFGVDVYHTGAPPHSKTFWEWIWMVDSTQVQKK